MKAKNTREEVKKATMNLINALVADCIERNDDNALDLIVKIKDLMMDYIKGTYIK
jgi:hypothetical protein